MKRVIIFLLFLSAISHYGKSQTWNPLGNGLTAPPNCIAPLEKLYIGAGWPPTTISGIPFRGFFTMDEAVVDTLDSGVYGFVNAVQWYNGKLIVGGGFNYAGGPTQWSIPFTRRLAAWDSLNGWSSINPMGIPNADIYAMQEFQSNLYIGGSFTMVNNVSRNRIAKWNGTSWSNAGPGFTGACQVRCIAVYHNQLYVGGAIGLPNGPNNYYYNIARYNGVQWDSVGGKFNFDVMSLVVDTVQDVLYAAGGFTQVGGVTAYGVAKWNDTIWTPVGSGFDTLWATQCLAIFNGELYAGGACVTTTTQGDTLRNIFKYNGIKWISVDGGANNSVLTMGVYEGNLYVGGSFTQVGNGINANRIACYGTTCPLGVGVPEQALPVPFKMYPNPNDDVLHIESEEPQQMIFRLSSIDGKLIVEQKFYNKIDYSIKELTAGNYFVEISLVDGSRRRTEKLVVK